MDLQILKQLYTEISKYQGGVISIQVIFIFITLVIFKDKILEILKIQFNRKKKDKELAYEIILNKLVNLEKDINELKAKIYESDKELLNVNQAITHLKYIANEIKERKPEIIIEKDIERLINELKLYLNELDKENRKDLKEIKEEISEAIKDLEKSIEKLSRVIKRVHNIPDIH